jgi:nucleoporin NUP82
MLAVYETIDLGLVSTLFPMSPSGSSRPLDLLQANHPVLLVDPIHDDIVYIYHAFGVHAIHLEAVLQSLAHALRLEDDESGLALQRALENNVSTSVHPLLTTFSAERR